MDHCIYKQLFNYKLSIHPTYQKCLKMLFLVYMLIPRIYIYIEFIEIDNSECDLSYM